MKNLDFGRCALNACVAAVMLSGCGGNAGGSVTPAVNGAGERLPFHKTFRYSGAEQIFTVPAGVKKLKVIAVGAQGGGEFQGYAGRVYAIIPVTPREELAIFVGGRGSVTSGGFNGGGDGGKGENCSCSGAGGGGASDIRQGGDRVSDRILVAGGGGGGGGSLIGFARGGTGGKGGGSTAGSGGNGGGSRHYRGGEGGRGGRQHAGGSGGIGGNCPNYSGYPGAKGMLYAGGAGGEGVYGPGAGGGGGGYYGGGGGGAGSSYGSECTVAGGGGGGGSSYIESSAYAYRSWQGWKKITSSDGLIVLSWK